MPIIDKIVDSLTHLFGGTKGKRRSPKTAKPKKLAPARSKVKSSKKKPRKKKVTRKKPAKKVSKKKAKKTAKRAAKKIIKKAIKKKPKKVAKKAVKKSAKKKAKKKAAKKTKPAKAEKKDQKASFPKPREILVGEITHYFSKIGVVVVHLKNYQMAVGDNIHIVGQKSDFTQKVKSLQIESVDVKIARKGKLVGLKSVKPAKAGDKVYKVP